MMRRATATAWSHGYEALTGVGRRDADEGHAFLLSAYLDGSGIVRSFAHGSIVEWRKAAMVTVPGLAEVEAVEREDLTQAGGYPA
jgi:hypothetical protein